MKRRNTQQSTNHWIKVWRSWAAQKGYDKDIENYEAEALNKNLEGNNATVLKIDDQDKNMNKFNFLRRVLCL